MPRPLFLPLDKENPQLMIEGRKRERAKAAKVGRRWEAYYEILKQRMEEEKLKPKVEEKAPRKVRVEIPVVNPEEVLEAKRLSDRG